MAKSQLTKKEPELVNITTTADETAETLRVKDTAIGEQGMWSLHISTSVFGLVISLQASKVQQDTVVQDTACDWLMFLNSSDAVASSYGFCIAFSIAIECARAASVFQT